MDLSQEDLAALPVSELALRALRYLSVAALRLQAADVVAAGVPLRLQVQIDAAAAMTTARTAERDAYQLHVEAAGIEGIPPRDLCAERAQIVTEAFALPWPPPQLRTEERPASER